MRRLPRRFAEQNDGASTAWMLTFSDLLTLLLTFFVMRISMATLDKQKLDEMFDAARVAKKAADAQQEEKISDSLNEDLSSMFGEPLKLQGQPEVVEFSADVKMKATPKGALLFLGGSSFESASDNLTVSGRAAIRQIARVLSSDNYDLDIAGHTDDVPIQTLRFPSNWELSAARAIRVAEEMISLGVAPKRISAVGYADTKPVESNDYDTGRARNRRVEIFVNRPSEY